MSESVVVKPSVRALLAHIVDYAGLFPPAQLDMSSTVRNYAAYLAAPDAWMLGRLVVPVARLDEFEEHAAELLPRSGGAEPWMITALTAAASDGDGLLRDLDRILTYNDYHGETTHGMAMIDVIELRADSAAAIDAALDRIPDDLFAFFEISAPNDPRGLIAALVGSDAGAKIRTGGVTVEAFPAIANVARFIGACAAADVPFKATAGLHHLLTHRNDQLDVQELGFLNVFLAGCIARMRGIGANAIEHLLSETSLDAFAFDDDAVAWREHFLSSDEIAEARQTFAVSFGSCSFDEPRGDLRAAGLV
jgi:hypothetical protein